MTSTTLVGARCAFSNLAFTTYLPTHSSHFLRLSDHSNPPLHTHTFPTLILIQIQPHLPHILEPTFPIQRMSQLASIDIASQPSSICVGKCPPYELGSSPSPFVIRVRAEQPEYFAASEHSFPFPARLSTGSIAGQILRISLTPVRLVPSRMLPPHLPRHPAKLPHQFPISALGQQSHHDFLVVLGAVPFRQIDPYAAGCNLARGIIGDFEVVFPLREFVLLFGSHAVVEISLVHF